MTENNENKIVQEDSTLLIVKRNLEILEGLEVESIENKIQKQKFNLLNQISRMENTKIQKLTIY